MYAVIRTGGKQYRVKPDDVLQIERIPGSAGDTIEFGEVLMVAGDGGVSVGSPLVEGATVAGELIAQTRGDKIIVFKKKRRHHYRRRNGHRQDLSEVRITEILTGGERPKTKAPQKAAEPEAEAAAEPAAEEAKAKPVKAAEKAKVEGDDLSHISGVGPVIVKRLHGEGITTFKQIAELTPEQAAELDQKLSLRGRIERDEWIAQARDLLAGKPPRAKTDRKAAEDKHD